MSSAAPPAIILARPQMGENIGAAARAMANFGLTDLRLVAPRDGWPNKKALDMASHAAPLIESARLYPDVPSAIADLTLVCACSARRRDMQKPHFAPAPAARALHAHAGRTGLLFGSERTGLENEELILADSIVTIPTAPGAASLNLAQAVVVLAYAWFAEQAEEIPPETATPMAAKGEIESYLRAFEARLDETNFWRVPEKKERMWLNLRQMVLRMRPDSQDIQTLHGVLRSLSNLRPR